MRCKACNTTLKEFDDELCNVCSQASKDISTPYKDPQHLLVTEIVDIKQKVKRMEVK